jgi:hypothetical protein
MKGCVTTALAVLVVVFASALSAQAPVPEALLRAKRAYMVNEAGDMKRFDSLADELRKWGRFELVDSDQKADIILVFGRGVKGHIATFQNGIGSMGPIVRISLEIRDRSSDLSLWYDESPPIRGTSRLVNHLRERVDAAEKRR